MRAKFIRNLLVLSIIVATASTVSAQDASRIYVEPTGFSIGTNFGMTDLWGDVGTKSPITRYIAGNGFEKVCFMGGLFGRYVIHPCLDLRLQLNWGALYANDNWNNDLVKGSSSFAIGNDAYQRYLRNQDIKDYMFEGLFMFEFMPFRMNPESHAAHRKRQLFIGAGIGGFYFTPYSTVGTSNHWEQIYDLHLEGQGWGTGYPKQYSLWQPCVPLVIGWRWDISKHTNIGIEYMYRFTFFDYLDGVSNQYIDSSQFRKHLSPKNALLAYEISDKTGHFNNGQPSGYTNQVGNLRGTPTNNDAYSTITVTFYYKINGRKREWWK